MDTAGPQCAIENCIYYPQPHRLNPEDTVVPNLHFGKCKKALDLYYNTGLARKCLGCSLATCYKQGNQMKAAQPCGKNSWQ
jgi:hypothetical protein